MQTDTTTPIADVFPLGAPPEPNSLEVLPPAAQLMPPSREAKRYDARTTPEFTPFACSEEIAELVAALSQAQLEFDEVERNKTAHVESRRTGAKYSYTYADLAAVITATRPHLSKHGLVIIQAPRILLDRKTCTIMTLLTHTSGQWMRADLPMQLESLDPQSIGAGITYGRRYAQQSLLNLAPEDDPDGASRPPAPQGNGNGSRSGQGSVQMPQRAEHVAPPPAAQTSAPPSASTTAAPHTAATPRPAPGAITIVALEKIPRAAPKTPWWKVKFSNGVAAVTFSTTMGADLELWRDYGSVFSAVRVKDKDGWTYLEEVKPFDGPRGGGK